MRKYMKRRWITYLFLLLLPASRTQATTPANDTAVMRQLIITYFDAVASKEFAKMEANCTADFVVYEDGRIWNNDSVYINIQRHEPFKVKFTLTDFQLFSDTRFGDGSYHSHADFVFHDSVSAALDFIETATFRNTKTGWKIHSVDVTSLAPPAVGFPRFYKRYDTVRNVPELYRQRMQLFKSET